MCSSDVLLTYYDCVKKERIARLEAALSSKKGMDMSGSSFTGRSLFHAEIGIET